MLLSNAFNNSNDEIDEIARNYNKKKLNNNIEKSNKKFEHETFKGIEAFSNETGFVFSPQTQFYNNDGTYKNDFVSGIPTPLDNDNNSNISLSLKSDSFKSDSLKSDNIESFNDLSSAYSFSSPSKKNNDLSSEYSFLHPKKKKHLRLNINHLNNFSDDDDKSVIEHVKKCSDCKNKLFLLLNENNDNHIIEKKEQKELIYDGILENINYKEMRDIIILIIIGIIIIFIFDIFLRK